MSGQIQGAIDELERAMRTAREHFHEAEGWDDVVREFCAYYRRLDVQVEGDYGVLVAEKIRALIPLFRSDPIPNEQKLRAAMDALLAEVREAIG